MSAIRLEKSVLLLHIYSAVLKSEKSSVFRRECTTGFFRYRNPLTKFFSLHSNNNPVCCTTMHTNRTYNLDKEGTFALIGFVDYLFYRKYFFLLQSKLSVPKA